jgi:ribosomal protein S18 acetylase RimI-like enzyme
VVSTAGVLIRWATQHDHDAVQTLDALVLGNSRRGDQLARRIQAGHCPTACEGDQVVGYVEADTVFHERGFVWLLVVHPARRRSIKSALLPHIEAACPIDQLFTSSNLSNARMRRLLEQHGYVRSGRIEQLDDGGAEIVYSERLHEPSGPSALAPAE